MAATSIPPDYDHALPKKARPRPFPTQTTMLPRLFPTQAASRPDSFPDQRGSGL